MLKSDLGGSAVRRNSCRLSTSIKINAVTLAMMFAHDVYAEGSVKGQALYYEYFFAEVLGGGGQGPLARTLTYMAS